MELIEKEAFTVVGLPVRAKWQDLWADMPKAWQKFFDRHHEIENRQDEAFIDVSLEKIGDEYLQLVCTRVTRVSQIPAGMRAIEVPAQQYIYHGHVGPVESIANSFGQMYDWAGKHGHPAGEFKVDFGYTVQGGEMEHDLYIGLLPAKPWRDAEMFR